MDNVSVQRELTTLFRQASGIDPDPRGWTTAIDNLFQRGATPSDIITRAKLGLSSQFHRPKLLDAGAKYIDWKYNDLIAGHMSAAPQRVRTVESMKYEGWRHQRWEVALHSDDPERAMTPQERSKWLEIYMSANNANAYDMVECPVCSERE